MGEVRTEVNKAIQTLGFNTDSIRLLNKEELKELYPKLLRHFVKSGDRRWWWEDFKQESFSFISSESPFEMLNEIIPKTKENVWFMIEDTMEDFYPIYEAKPEIIQNIIGECFGFEYYIIDKNLEWLICENHHNRLIGIGEKLKTINLDKIKN